MRDLLNKDLGFLFEFCLGHSDSHFPSGIFVQLMNFFFLFIFSLPLSMFLKFTCLSPAAMVFFYFQASKS